MSNEEAGKPVNSMEDLTKQLQDNTGDSASSGSGRIISLTLPPVPPVEARISGETLVKQPESSVPLPAGYVRIPIAGRLPVRVKDSDWPIRYQCVIPFRQRASLKEPDHDYSFFGFLHGHIADKIQNIVYLSPDGWYQPDRCQSEWCEPEWCGPEVKITPPSCAILRPRNTDDQKTKSGFCYKEAFVFLRCHQDGRAILYATYKQSGVEFPLEGVILSPESGYDEIFDCFKALLSGSCLAAFWMLEYDWIATLMNASRKPVEQLSPDANSKDCVEFINENGRMVSFSKTEWPVVASSSLGKGEISTNMAGEDPGVFYYERLDVHKHVDGRMVVHAYQEYNSSTRANLQEDGHIFDIFLMSRGMVVPMQADLYAAIQQIVKRIGFAPDTGAMCINALPGEDLL